MEKKTKRSSKKRSSKKRSSKKANPKYERCVIAVKKKQKSKCFKNLKWVGGEGCVNPWAVCTSKVGRYLL